MFKADRPPFTLQPKGEEYLRFGKAIAHFINNMNHQLEALQYAIEKTCRIVERLLPLLIDSSDTLRQEMIARCVETICKEDEVNRYALIQVMKKVGQVKVEGIDTTIEAEFNKYNGLVEILKKAQDEISSKRDGMTNYSMRSRLGDDGTTISIVASQIVEPKK